jgi:hypothetical protein
MEMPVVSRQARLIEFFVQSVAFGTFGFYLLWNALWIASGRVPVSILQALAGVPCPTTGCTRSVLALLHGEWSQAFLWNPFALAYVLLLAYSGTVLARQFLKRERLVLRPFVGHLWAVALAAGWIAKFALGPRFW